MRNSFFDHALAAAKQSPKAFVSIFEKKEADANVKEFVHMGQSYGEPLIHCLIRIVPDEDLPAILAVLVQHQVDLEKEHMDERPLAFAARYCKKEAINFLLKHKVEVNNLKRPALFTVMIGSKNELLRLDIVKLLLQHKADINIQNEVGKTPLFRAAEGQHLESMRYLISQDANLFSKHVFNVRGYGMMNQTALSVVYDKYILARINHDEKHEETINAKNCLNLLITTAIEYLYRQGVSFQGENKKLEMQLKSYISDLAGNFYNFEYPDQSNDDHLKNLLEKQVLLRVLKRIKIERIHAFCMGSRLTTTQKTINDPAPSIYRFFHRNDARNLVPKIFSYLHEDIVSFKRD